MLKDMKRILAASALVAVVLLPAAYSPCHKGRHHEGEG
jgi:hypothetical protein